MHQAHSMQQALRHSCQSPSGACSQSRTSRVIPQLHPLRHAASQQQQCTPAITTSGARRRQQQVPRALNVEQLSVATPQRPDAQFVGVIGGMQTVRGSLVLDQVQPDQVYMLLTDYDSCPRVFSGVAGSSTAHVDGRKHVTQCGKWQFLTFSGTFDVTLDVTEEPGSRLLVFRLVRSTFMEDFEGRWKVTPLPGGGCHVEHQLAVKPSIPIPAAIAPFTAKLFRAQVIGLLNDLAAEMRRQQTAAYQASDRGEGVSRR